MSGHAPPAPRQVFATNVLSARVFGFTGGLPENFGGISIIALQTHHRHRVEIGGIGFEPQPLRFQGQRPAAGERVVKAWQLVAIEQLLGARMVDILRAGPPPALPNFRARPLQHLLVVVFSHWTSSSMRRNRRSRSRSAAQSWRMGFGPVPDSTHQPDAGPPRLSP
jgi:hypothetical protein